MGVAVLNPQDCLRNPLSSQRGLTSLPPRIKPHGNPNPNNSVPRSNRAQSNRRKRSSNISPPSRAAVIPKVPAPVMGQVKILKRGEQLPKTTTTEKVVEKKIEDLDLGSTHRLGPDPKLVPTQIRVRLAESESNNNNGKANGFYAGSAFFTSPPPSSLPLPAFFMKKNCAVADVKNDDATSDLRRMLGLSF